jgi:tetratricopeptide (TPR) repeat protein
MSRRIKKKARTQKVPVVGLGTPVSQAGEKPRMGGSRPPESERPPADLNDRWMAAGICIFLAAIIWTVFGQTLHHEFVNFDDNRYVYDNPVVQKGLTWEGFRWALTYGAIGHWHPLTWLSHMLDCQLYGLNAGGPHLTNVLLHTAAAILFFLLLWQMTGFLWRSAFVAAVFAIHPLRAESVAWVAERKDVLSALFFMLTLGAYVRYVSRPSVIRYCTVMLLFALGLLSKNMLVTMPFVFLLLDYWPLNRLSGPPVLRRLVAEKIPLFVLAVGSCVATTLVPEKLFAGSRLPFELRMENAVVSCVTYLWQMIYPSGLACFYPNPANHLPLWQVAGALGLLLAMSGAAWTFRKTHPNLIVGWLWYLGMMVPVIGIVQISYYAHADRYTYLPQIGLYLSLTWLATDLCAGWRHRRAVLGCCSTIILAALIFCARTQVSYWRNSESLWTHTLACTSDNAIAHNSLGAFFLQQGRLAEAVAHIKKSLEIEPYYAEAHYNLGTALFQQGQLDEAISHFQMALEIKPDYADACNNLGNALLHKGDEDDAIAYFKKALQIKPGFAEACYNIGSALLQEGKTDEAIVYDQKALQIKPDSAEAHNNLGNALLKNGGVDEAVAHFKQALQIKPGFAEAHYNLANALLQKGVAGEAIANYQQALQSKPDYAKAMNNLAWVLATCPQASLRNGKRAVELSQRANQLAGGENPAFLGTLSAAYAEAGRFPEAAETTQRALQLAGTSSNSALAASLQSQLKLYQAGIPFHLR